MKGYAVILHHKTKKNFRDLQFHGLELRIKETWKPLERLLKFDPGI